MSQHVFETSHEGRDVSVTLGFDRPLGHVFMVIAYKQVIGDGPENLYSNLDEEDPFDQSLEHFGEALQHFGIDVPKSMFEQVDQDRKHRVGNRYVVHQASGQFTELSPG